MGNKRPFVAFALELLIFVVIVVIAKAGGFLDPLVNIGLLIGFWLYPLILSTLNVIVFWRGARAAKMPLSFTAGTLIVIFALSAAAIGLLYHQAQLYWGIAAVALAFYAFVLLRTSGLGRLAATFRQSTDMWPGFPGFPATPNSRFATLPMFEFIGGAALIALITIAPASKLYGLWIYVPAVMCLSVGLIMQLCHLRAAHALERESSNGRA